MQKGFLEKIGTKRHLFGFGLLASLMLFLASSITFLSIDAGSNSDVRITLLFCIIVSFLSIVITILSIVRLLIIDDKR